MEETSVKFTGFKNNDDMVESFYQKLNQGRDVSMDESFALEKTYLNPAGASNALNNNNNNSVTVSVASNNSRTPILSHQHQYSSESSRLNPLGSFGRSVFRPSKKLRRELKDDALAKLLMDSNHPTEALEDYEEWTIDLKKLIMTEAFAEGAYGRLFRGRYNGEDVAIKMLERAENRPDLEKPFHQELSVLATLNHPNIVRFIGACRKPEVCCIVTEYAKGGSLRQFLEKRKSGPMPLKLTLKYALDVAKGMSYIHGLGFIHRDLKSDNLLIAADKSIKIADFGFARIEAQNELMTPDAGTYRWMAPELIQRKRYYTRKVDVYSFGVVLWELITGLLPYGRMTGLEVANSVVRGGRPDIPVDCIPVLREIITTCWDSDPDVRPHFPQIIDMLENAGTQAITTVRKARFRCCITQPMIID
ncbi:hypothetical protein PTKIN_Ptkin18bG0013500 [Pterospermum kingtungense]